MSRKETIKILITGSEGFVGRNLRACLKQNQEFQIYNIDIHNTEIDLVDSLNQADLIYHLAGVNRPKKDNEFWEGNVEFTQQICEYLIQNHLNPKIVFSSSIQAELDNPYGKSKKAAEQVIKKYVEKTGADCVVYRLKNLFGKWCRPNYNAVTATFCYNITHHLPVQISDPDHTIDLTYIDDVTSAFENEITKIKSGFSFAPELPFHSISLGSLAEKIKSYHNIKSSLMIPDLSIDFERMMYATYLSYLDDNQFGYRLQIRSDDRGNLAEFLKSSFGGQIFISRTKPGIKRGNHYHHTKTEKFLVLEGQARIQFRHIEKENIITYDVNGDDYQVLDVPPGYTHSIENRGTTDLITLFWASEIFNQDKPDTYFNKVVKED